MYFDYDRVLDGWAVFDAVSGQTIARVPHKWSARLLSAVLNRFRAEVSE